MPIRFACTACGQKLSISARQAGNQVNCPRCQKPTIVPAEPAVTAKEVLPASAVAATAVEALVSTTSTAPEVEAPPIAQGETNAAEEQEDDFPHFVVYDHPSDAPHLQNSFAGKLPEIFQRTITIPRYVIYAQGALLAIVGVVCLGLGILIGGSLLRPSAIATAVGPVTVQGTISYQANNRRLADEGAVVAVLPDTKDPGERAKVIGLRATDPAGGEGAKTGIAQISNMGGAITRADAKGNFQVKLPSGGKFFLLVISAHQVRKGAEPSLDDVRRIGRFFEGATDLLGQSHYRFTSQNIRSDIRINEVFDSP